MIINILQAFDRLAARRFNGSGCLMAFKILAFTEKLADGP